MKKQIILALALLIVGALPAQEKGSYLDFNIGGGLHNLSYTLLNGTEKGKVGYTLNAGYSYFFTPNWGIRTGLGFQTFSSVSTISFLSSTPDVDSQGQAYMFNANYMSLQEKQQVMLLDVPLAIQYRRPITNKIGLLVSLGGKIAFPFQSTFKTTGGQFVTTGYYSIWNVPLSDMPQHGFATMTNSFTGNTALKTAYMGIFDLGALYKLSHRLDLYLGGYVNYGLNNILTSDTKLIYQPNGAAGTPGTYNGLLASTQTRSVTPISFGIKVGVYLHLGKNKHTNDNVTTVESADSKHLNNQSNRIDSLNDANSLNPAGVISKDGVGSHEGSGIKTTNTTSGQSSNANVNPNGASSTDQSGRSLTAVNPLNATNSLNPTGAQSKDGVGGQIGSGIKATNTTPGQSSNANVNPNGASRTDQSGRSLTPVTPLNATNSLNPTGAQSKDGVSGHGGTGIKTTNTIPGQSSNANVNPNATTTDQSGRSLTSVNPLNATNSLNPAGVISKVAVGGHGGSGIKTTNTISGQSSNANVNPNGASSTDQSGRSLTSVTPLNALNSLNPAGAQSKDGVGGHGGSVIKATNTIPGQSSNANVNPNGASSTDQSGRSLTPVNPLNATNSLNPAGAISKVAVGGHGGTGIKTTNTISGQSSNANVNPNGARTTDRFGRSTDSLSTAGSVNPKSAVSKEGVAKPAPRGLRKFLNSILSRPSSRKLNPIPPIDPSNLTGKDNPDQSTGSSSPAGQNNSDQPIDPAFERAKEIAASMNLQFGFDSYQAANAKDANIKELSEILIANPKIHLLFIGHTCDIGSREINIKLGMKRVENVMQRFIEQGVPEIQLIGESKAYDDPLVPNTSAENRAKNRREEIKVFKKSGF